MSIERFSGILAPVVTPFKDDLSPDMGRFLNHCRWVKSQNANLAIFGTNSEANSLSVKEKIDLLEKLISSGPAAIKAPTIITLEIAFVTAISGECNADVTPQIT